MTFVSPSRSTIEKKAGDHIALTFLVNSRAFVTLTDFFSLLVATQSYGEDVL